VQFATGDELLPFVDKPDLLQDAYTLTCVVPVVMGDCYPFDKAAGRSSYNLGTGGAVDQTPTGITLPELLIGPVGDLELRVLDASNAPIDPATWSVAYTGSTPTSIRFTGTPPTGAKVSAWKLVATPTVNWALPGSGVYAGPNSACSLLLAYANGGTTAVKMTATAISSGPTSHLVFGSAQNSVKVSYYYTATKGTHFCGDHVNWVGDHYMTWPDVFVGTNDYPGDSTIDPNTSLPIDPGRVPAERSPSTYSINYRDGVVIFPDTIDTTAQDLQGNDMGTVKASYAYLQGIDNVTGMQLDLVASTGGKRFRASTETIFTAAHGKRWITRNNQYTPLNVYVNGVKTPATLTALNETLTVKTS
jgi:hypothetical protein